MDSIWNGLCHRIKIVCHAALILSLIVPTTHAHAQNHRCSMLNKSIANEMFERAKKEILRPLNNLKSKSNLCMDDIVRACVQTKKNADKIHNTGKDTATVFKEFVSFLKKERGVSLPSKQVKSFSSMLSKCEREMHGKKDWSLHIGFQAKTHHPRHSDTESDAEEINVNQGLAFLEGMCGALFIILGGYLQTTSWGQKTGEAAMMFGYGLCTDVGIKVFGKDMYEDETKNKSKR